ncbi:hypothetical protein PHMEG_00025519 [Phytophthora megakarya]|uniref:RxLR effector protein n=1 Tax=Phytophthora megakarya TaxID=4795 RepID=A0A225VBZ7_9STRA|nr:hypothetical protein PHMEG_00025519 [Phytophthora megakarya]
MIHWNSQSKNEPFTVAKMFNDQLGSKKSFEMFAVAAKSANPNVEQMGKSYQIQLFKLFQKAENTPGQISTSLGGDAAAAKMFITVMQSTSKSDRKLGMKFANGFLKQWKEAGKTPAQLEQIAPTFLKTYATLLRATEKSAIKANPIRAAAAAAARV